MATEEIFQNLCKELAKERVNILFPNEENNKELYVNALRIRLSRMFDDFFDAGHLNAIAIDTVDELNRIAKIHAEAVRKAQSTNGNSVTGISKRPETIVRIVGATPEDVKRIFNGLCG